MASEKQIAANRANSAKSRGPRTAAGREKSSRNSLRHGLLARTIVLKCESLNRFSDLLASLHHEFQPSNIIECMLVENMAVARWRQLRLWGVENADLSSQIRKQQSDPACLAEDPASQTALAFRTLSDESRSLDLLDRYENRFERQYSRALDRLIQLRAKGIFAKRTHLPLDSDVTQPRPQESGSSNIRD